MAATSETWPSHLPFLKVSVNTANVNPTNKQTKIAIPFKARRIFISKVYDGLPPLSLALSVGT